MGQALRLRLTTLKVPEFGLRAYREKLIAAKLNFLLWGWNWVSAVIVKKWRLHLRQSEREGDLVRGEDICVVQDTSLVRKRMADDGLLRTLRRYMAVALMQILRPSQTMYMPTWQVEFVELQPLS
ncbi:hypothetical protein AXG93_1660s1530 [Marchantia polymorpha subsp. ruderalis]|uniref:Uncharacterized protein n=1 Tax=Marchantia polymorpha subsp. ruderalis TaxID=1480154 RepID=A0A176VR59_MARPO|nr:hypothetical protein AXG93_1660s1530 [Marchantia polymorpha subsp. ruderalis]